MVHPSYGLGRDAMRDQSLIIFRCPVIVVRSQSNDHDRYASLDARVQLYATWAYNNSPQKGAKLALRPRALGSVHHWRLAAHGSAMGFALLSRRQRDHTPKASEGQRVTEPQGQHDSHPWRHQKSPARGQTNEAKTHV